MVGAGCVALARLLQHSFGGVQHANMSVFRLPTVRIAAYPLGCFVCLFVLSDGAARRPEQQAGGFQGGGRDPKTSCNSSQSKNRRFAGVLQCFWTHKPLKQLF
eukprot:3341922-Amphidinium_carterae.1